MFCSSGRFSSCFSDISRFSKSILTLKEQKMPFWLVLDISEAVKYPDLPFPYNNLNDPYNIFTNIHLLQFITNTPKLPISGEVLTPYLLDPIPSN